MRHFGLSAFITVFLLVGAMACGPAPSKEASSGPVQWWSPSARSGSPDEFKSTSDELSRIDYRCEAGAACTNSVALLLFGGPGVERFETEGGASPLRLYELWNCTGVFLSPNLILTNAHCIPKNKMHSGASLQGAGSGKLLDGRIFSLGNVVAIGKLSESLKTTGAIDSLASAVAQDWALVRVTDRLPHHFVGLEPEPMVCAERVSTEKLVVLAIDPQLEKTSEQARLSKAILRAKSCSLTAKVTSSEALSVSNWPESHWGESPIFYGDSCDTLVRGNSGAPVFYRDQFFGIISMSPATGIGIFVKTDQKLLGTIVSNNASTESPL